MKCNSESLIAFALGDLDEIESKRVESHIETCQACGQRVAELRRTVDLLGALAETESRPVALDRLRAEIASRRRSFGRRFLSPIAAGAGARWRWGFATVAVAASVLLCFHYGVALQVGGFEIAFGGPERLAPVSRDTLALDEALMRQIAQDEIAATVGPAFVQIAQRFEDIDERHRRALVSLGNDWAMVRALDQSEVERNLRLIASTMDEALGGPE